MSRRREIITALAGLTLREALRQRFAAGLALVAALLALSGIFLSGIDLGGERARFLADIGFGAFVLFGSALAIIVPATSLFSDLDQRTAQSILAKPVARWEYLVGKWLGTLAVLALFSGVLLTLIAAQLLWDAAASGANGLSLLGLALAGLVTWLRLAVLAALALVVGSYARSQLFTILAGGGAVVIGQLQYLARDAWQAAEHPFAKVLAWLVAKLFPNLQAFDVANLLIFEQAPNASAGAVFGVLGYGVLYASIYLLGAIWIFERREL